MLKEKISQESIQALKDKDTFRRSVLSLLLCSLKNAEINKRSVLTEEEELAVAQREIKQTQDTLDSANGREDVIKKAQETLKILEEFVPTKMTFDEILGIVMSFTTTITPVKSNKGLYMKNVMPLVKGRADGKVVNQIIDSVLK